MLLNFMVHQQDPTETYWHNLKCKLQLHIVKRVSTSTTLHTPFSESKVLNVFNLQDWCMRDNEFVAF